MTAGVHTDPLLQSTPAGIDGLAGALAATTPRRLALIVGDEVFSAGAGPEAVALAEALGAPVFGSSWPGHISFPTAHPQWRGTLPSKASEVREALSFFEAVLLLGGHALISYPYSDGPAVPPDCRLLQVTSDGHQLGRVYGTTMGLVGDLRLALQALLPILVPWLAPRAEAISAAREAARREREARRTEVVARAEEERRGAGITPFVAAYETLRAIGPEVAIVDEVPVTLQHVRACLDSHSARQYVFTRSAILGWAMPAAAGFSLGLGHSPVACLVGDGSAMYSPQALWTAAHERLPVTYIVMNNGEYNILKNYIRSQAHYRSRGTDRFIGMDMTDPAIDFAGSQLRSASRRVGSCRPPTSHRPWRWASGPGSPT